MIVEDLGEQLKALNIEDGSQTIQSEDNNNQSIEMAQLASGENLSWMQQRINQQPEKQNQTQLKQKNRVAIENDPAS